MIRNALRFSFAIALALALFLPAASQAQVKLLQQPQYAEPFFWAPFLLINDWL